MEWDLGMVEESVPLTPEEAGILYLPPDAYKPENMAHGLEIAAHIRRNCDRGLHPLDGVQLPAGWEWERMERR